MDDPGVDGPHDERRQPNAEVVIELCAFQARLPGFGAVFRRADRKRVGQFLAQFRVGGRFLGDVHHAGYGATGELALGNFDPHPHILARSAKGFRSFFLQEPDPHV